MKGHEEGEELDIDAVLHAALEDIAIDSGGADEEGGEQEVKTQGADKKNQTDIKTKKKRAEAAPTEDRKPLAAASAPQAKPKAPAVRREKVYTDFEPEMVATRKIVLAEVDKLQGLIEACEVGIEPRTVKELLAAQKLAMADLAKKLLLVQQRFEETVRKIRCRAWEGAIQEANASAAGHYALAPVWY